MLRGNAREIYDAICLFWEGKAYAPSFDELEAATGLARGTVQHHINALIEGDYLRQDVDAEGRGVSRSLRPVGMVVDLREARRRVQGET